jgi:membrane associated rhomboid family serine protease
LFVPLHDANPLKSIPFQYVTVALIALNVLGYVFVGTNLIPELHSQEQEFSLIPAEFLGGARLPAARVLWLENALPVPEQFTIVSYMFLHGGMLHLIGNMLFLWVFGDNVEDAMGHLRFLMFYLMCGIFAGLTHAIAAPSSEVPLVGASGAVAGVVAAYLMLHPRVKVWVLVLFRIPLRVNAGWALGFWIGLQFFNVLVAGESNVAWWAHIGGVIAGAVLILFMRRPGVILFDRTRSGA